MPPMLRFRRSPRRNFRHYAIAAVAISLVLASAGCAILTTFWKMPLSYRAAKLPAGRIVRDVPYRNGADAHPEKHRLDVFRPPTDQGAPWPVLVFVHGGGWTSGDKSLSYLGNDVFGNIGRFYAARGLLTVVPSYRLQPGVDWRAQVEDIADVVAWVRSSAADYGGNPDAIFLSGHSAGAQLVSYVTLEREHLVARGVTPESVCGFVSVSGSAFDLADPETYELGFGRDYFEQRFRNGSPTNTWAHEASLVHRVGPDAPAALLIYGEKELGGFERQATLLRDALVRANVPVQMWEAPGENHVLIVPALSRPRSPTSETVLAFLRETRCGTGQDPRAVH